MPERSRKSIADRQTITTFALSACILQAGAKVTLLIAGNGLTPHKSQQQGDSVSE